MAKDKSKPKEDKPIEKPVELDPERFTK